MLHYCGRVYILVMDVALCSHLMLSEPKRKEHIHVATEILSRSPGARIGSLFLNE